MRLPVDVLVVICLVVGVVPAATVGPYLHTAALSVLGPATPAYSLKLWHGINAPLVMSIVALAVGASLYALLAGPLSRGPEGPPLLRRLRGQRIFERGLTTFWWRWPRALYRILGTERLQWQLRILVLLALAALAWEARDAALLDGAPRGTRLDPVFALAWLAGAACAIAAAWQAKYHRFAALALLGGAGVLTCVTFVWFSAADLAVTQLLVEIVTTVLLLLGLRWLPKRSEAIAGDARLTARLRRAADLVIALACGAGIAAIAHAVMTRPQISETGAWFLENAYSEGGGTNVVNVILVDFRAFDTFGEITVLGIVGLSVFALLRRFRPARESIETPEQQKIQSAADASAGRDRGDAVADYLRVPKVVMQWMFPAIITFSAYLFLRGHDLPGGGFAAGVALAIGFLLQYLAADARWVEDRLRILPVRWMGTGLLLAAATGLGAFLFGYPFLTMSARYVTLPVIGDVPVATALLFDLGVFALVVGATIVVLVALAHQSLRGRARAEAAEAETEAPAAVVEEA
jgi:multicomponent K+:H+ antiporter subunit A